MRADVAAVIPVYNHPATIGAMVAGVHAADLHAVLVDDGSEPGCAAVLDRLAAGHGPARVTLVRLAQNQGKGGAMMAGFGIRKGVEALAFGGSSAAALGIISSVGLSMFPFILPSSIDPHSSLTVWNASSSHMTLFIMLLVTVVFLPIVLAYTAWAYKVMWGRVTLDNIRSQPDLY